MNTLCRCLNLAVTGRLAALLLACALLPGVLRAAPGMILFSDTFEDGNLAPWTTTNAGVSGVSGLAGYAGTGTIGAFTSNTAVTVTSPVFNANVPEARLDIWIRRGADSFSEDTDNNEDFILEYQRGDGVWVGLQVYFGSGTKGQVYNDSFVLPPDALHAALALRLRQTGGSGAPFDFWHFDDVVVTELAAGPTVGVGSCDDFEGGLNSNWTINPTSGFAGTSSVTSSSASHSMYVYGGVIDVTSNVIDTSSAAFGDLSVWIRRGADAFSEDPDFGENLQIRYLDDNGSWILLQTFTGNGPQGQIFTPAYTLPPAGRHPNFRLRFSQTGGSGPIWDFWHIDDVCFDLSVNPVLQVVKMARTLSDPVNGTTNPKAIPGAAVEYTIGVTNQGGGNVDNNSLTITEVVPANTALYVDTGSGDPMVFIDGPTASGLPPMNYATDVIFSNQVGGGPPYNYVPGTSGYDPAVTGFLIQLQGTMNASSGGNDPSFNIQFRVRVE